jgi:hypothetical protein
MRASVDTAGVRARIECRLSWVSRLLQECCGDALQPEERAAPPDGPVLDVCIEETRDAFDITGLTTLTRSVWAGGGHVVVRDVCTSGFDMRLTVDEEVAAARYRWRPTRATHAAALALRSRFHLLARAALLQYPAMWLASRRDAVPLHAPVCTAGAATVLLAGPGGVGKTTLLLRELEAGGEATSDNLCVSDGRRCWGVVEPLRAEGAGGRRMPHGRAEAPLARRAPCLTPGLVVLLTRTTEARPAARTVAAQRAARFLAGGTYMAGELRRYWPLAATLATATGVGPVHPAVASVAERLARGLPCVEVTVPAGSRMRLREVLGTLEPLAIA